MERHDACYRQYVQILREELRPATGCTEPIAIAYAAAKARSVLGALPDRVLVEVSGNIIKNVKSVVVPHTGGLRGIPAAAAAGIVAGDAEAQLEVLSAMTEAQSAAISPFLKVVPVEVRHADTPYIFDIQVTVFHGPDSAQVRLVGHGVVIPALQIRQPCGGAASGADGSAVGGQPPDAGFQVDGHQIRHRQRPQQLLMTAARGTGADDHRHTGGDALIAAAGVDDHRHLAPVHPGIAGCGGVGPHPIG